ncbi:MAG TPA: hypothetical protein VLA19_32280 [Herpetosiphonaceae bacterium]|nr:hypothetical protein [Herpetosiphonaceae bacterium]
MTKRDVFALWSCRQHVADLNPAIADDHSINQQFHQLPSLGKRQVLQGRLESTTKGLKPFRRCHHIYLFVCLRLQLAQLLHQACLCLAHLLAFAVEFVPANHLGQIHLQQPRLLALKLGDGCRETGKLDRSEC